MSGCRIIYKGGTGEIVEKKSRFISELIPIDSEDDALKFIELKKKRHWDASHNCSAYVFGFNHEIERCQDDGEPNRTAGRPMLEVLLLEGIHNAAVVVTRYFGGVLLGTGGLIRAYQAAVKECLKNCIIAERMPAGVYQVSTDYSGIGKLMNIAGNMELKLLDTIYTDSVEASLLIPPDKEGEFIKRFNEAVSKSADIVKKEEVHYVKIDCEYILL